VRTERKYVEIEENEEKRKYLYVECQAGQLWVMRIIIQARAYHRPTLSPESVNSQSRLKLQVLSEVRHAVYVSCETSLCSSLLV